MTLLQNNLPGFRRTVTTVILATEAPVQSDSGQGVKMQDFRQTYDLKSQIIRNSSMKKVAPVGRYLIIVSDRPLYVLLAPNGG
jgi:hypothetical protein